MFRVLYMSILKKIYRQRSNDSGGDGGIPVSLYGYWVQG